MNLWNQLDALSKVNFQCQLDCFSSLEDVSPSVQKASLVLNLLGTDLEASSEL